MEENINVVLCWHMHQPHYRDALDGTYHLPWVYLHAIKDYSDMAHHLETCPEARVVVNFAPVLLEQLTDVDSSFTLISADTITFQFISNDTDQAAGWEASISCMDGGFYSNGNGGGNWNDPAAWYGGSVPTASDDAVVLW